MLCRIIEKKFAGFCMSKKKKQELVSFANMEMNGIDVTG